MAYLCREIGVMSAIPALHKGGSMRVILTAMAFVAASLTVAAAQDADARRIVVMGQGTTTIPHDSAVLRLGVESEAATADAALDTLGSELQAVIDALVAEGLGLNEIETAQLSLYQRNESGGLGSLPGPTSYVASSVLTVTTLRIGEIGVLLDAAVEAGANRIDSVGLEVADTARALEEARRMAVADGMAKAQVLAEAAGVELGDLMIIRDGASGGGPVFGDVARMSVPVVPGQGDLSVTVEMVFAING